MKRLLLFILLTILLAICIGLLSASPNKDCDGPAPAIGEVQPSGWPNSFDFSSDNLILFAGVPAGPPEKAPGFTCM